MKAVIYVRVSKIDLHPENQKIELEDYAKRQGWEYEVFEEKESTRKTRPIKDDILKNSMQGKFDVILVYKLDRWARSLQELIIDLDNLEQHKVEYRSLKDNIVLNDDPRNKLMIHMLGAFAEFEREMIRERTLAGLERARREGKKLGRPKISSYSRKQIRELYPKLKSIRAVSKNLRVSYATVWNVINQRGANKDLEKSES